MMKGNTYAANQNGTYRIQNSSGTTIQVTVPGGTATSCPSGNACGALYLATPILGFEVGNPGATNSNSGTNFYNSQSCDATCAAFGAHIKNLGFNCQQQDGCVGWQNLYAEEESGVDTFGVNQLNFAGFDNHGVHAQNFGPILNGEVYTGGGNTACDYGTVGGYIGDSAMRGFNSWTINQSTNAGGSPLCGGVSTPHQPIAAVLLDAPTTEVRNGHCEGFSNCVLMGANVGSGGGASGQRVSNMVGPPSGNAGTYVVQVSANNPNSDYVVSNIHEQNSGDTANFFDGVNAITISDNYLGFYSASINNGLTNILTSDTSVPTRLDSGLTSSFTSVLILNSASTPPALNKLVKLIAPPLRAGIATTGDTKGAVIGVCVANCTATGSSTIAITGIVGCVFDTGSAAGDWVVVSVINNGECHDFGSMVPVPPTTETIIGHVLATTSSGTANVLLQVAR